MSAPRPEDDAPWLDELAALARQETPPPLGPGRADDMVERALQDSGVRRTARTGARRPGAAPAGARVARGQALAWLAAAAAVALAAGVGWALRPGPAPLHATLPSGDGIDATPGASFELRELTPTTRRVAVLDGTVLFDVAPLATGEAFVVETEDARVEVRGTVFSVERAGGDTRVRVYEGRVDVVRADRRTSVGAGRMWAADGTSTLRPGPLGAAGARAAARRSAASARPAAVTPATTDPALAAPGTADQAAAEAPTGTTDAPPSTGPAPPEPRPDLGDDARDHGDRGAGAKPDAGPGPDAVRRWIAEGRVDEALAAARGALLRRPGAGAWRVVLGDALEAAGRPGAAADAYDGAARTLQGPAAARAAFLAGTIRFRDLDDPAGAVRSIDAARAAAPGSPLRERALGLRARARLRAGDTAGARRDAGRYLDAYPDGSLAGWTRALGRDEGDVPGP